MRSRETNNFFQQHKKGGNCLQSHSSSGQLMPMSFSSTPCFFSGEALNLLKMDIRAFRPWLEKMNSFKATKHAKSSFPTGRTWRLETNSISNSWEHRSYGFEESCEHLKLFYDWSLECVHKKAVIVQFMTNIANITWPGWVK